MSQKLTDSKSTTACKMHIVGGKSMDMTEYASYIQALSMKPFLTAHEASTYFNIGINKIYRMMKEPAVDFVVDTDSQRACARIHRVRFEEWILAHADGKEV